MRDAASVTDLARRVTEALRDVQDFPKPGIVFKDITPLLADAALFGEVAAAMADPFREAGVTHVAGVESRGFIFGAVIARELGCGFVPIRKPGKLPARVVAREYALEYGTDRLEIHSDAYSAGSRVLLVDDVLATGGTAEAAAALLEEVGGLVVGCSFLLAIGALGGARRLVGRWVEMVATL